VLAAAAHINDSTTGASAGGVFGTDRTSTAGARTATIGAETSGADATDGDSWAMTGGTPTSITGADSVFTVGDCERFDVSRVDVSRVDKSPDRMPLCLWPTRVGVWVPVFAVFSSPADDAAGAVSARLALRLWPG